MASAKDKDKTKRRGPSAAAKIKDAVGKATKSANGRAKKYKGQFEQMVGRRNVEAGEIVVGAMLGGAAHGADVSLAVPIGDDKKLNVPVSLPIGGGLVVLGAFMKDDKHQQGDGWQDDAQAGGLGMFAFGLGRVIEDVVRDALKD